MMTKLMNEKQEGDIRNNGLKGVKLRNTIKEDDDRPPCNPLIYYSRLVVMKIIGRRLVSL
jgi:hypothetical protein